MASDWAAPEADALVVGDGLDLSVEGASLHAVSAALMIKIVANEIIFIC